jgi:DUF1365 family protein
VTQSALYEGHIRHRRYAVRNHEFRYRIALAYVDLEELPSLLDGRLVKRTPGLVRFRRRDYLGDPQTPLDESVRALVEERTGRRPSGPIRLLTHLRTFGRCFNPVSFYYCFAPDGERVEAVVAEVTNTPWGERHAYVSQGRGGEFDKALHVSPFMPMDQRYTWRATKPGATASVQIESHKDGEKAFEATLSLKRKPLTRRSLASHPGSALRLLPLIYGHAVALKLKGVPVQPHPAR